MFKKFLKNKQLVVTAGIAAAAIIVFGVIQIINYDMTKSEALQFKETGDKYYETGDMRNAVIYYNLALEADPKYEEVYLIFYDMYLEQGDRMKAREYLSRAVEVIGSDKLIVMLAEADYTVEFSSLNFLGYIKKNHLSEDLEEVWRSDLDSITVIDANIAFDEGIHDDIRHFRNLETLRLKRRSNEYIVNNFAHVPKLTHLEINGGKWYLPAGAEFGHLTELTLSSVEVFDGIEDDSLQFPKLMTLTMSKCVFKDDINLGIFSKLETLTMKECGLTGISKLGIENLANLMALNLATNKIDDISVLESLTKLRWLDLTGNNVSDITPLVKLAALKELVLNSNKITDFRPLSSMKTLDTVNIAGNPYEFINAKMFENIPNVKGMPSRLPVDDNDFYIRSWSSDIMEQAVHSSLWNLSSYVNILKSDLEDIAHLSFNNYTDSAANRIQISAADLKEVEYMPNITSLYISGCEFDDLSVFAGHEITYISLDNTLINDSSAIAGFTELNSMNIYGAELRGLPSLKELTKLSYLYVSNRYDTDMSWLSGSGITELANLEYVSVNGNITEFSWMSDYKNLKTLYIYLYYYEGVIDYSPLAGLTNLTSLDISHAGSISWISSLAKLERLSISYSPGITDFKPLTNLSSLSNLSISGEIKGDMSPLGGLTGLEMLYITYAEGVDYSPLAALTQLKSFNISLPYSGWEMQEHRETPDLSVLAGLTNLTSLYAYGNNIEDLSVFAGLTGLQSLDLSNNSITDVSPLANLVSLTNLSLSNNQIADVSPLANLVNLTDLSLSDNQITDVTPLAGLSGLNWLYLSGNLIEDLSPLDALKPTIMYMNTENNPGGGEGFSNQERIDEYYEQYYSDYGGRYY